MLELSIGSSVCARVSTLALLRVIIATVCECGWEKSLQLVVAATVAAAAATIAQITRDAGHVLCIDGMRIGKLRSNRKRVPSVRKARQRC